MILEVNTLEDLLAHFKAREKALEDARKYYAEKSKDLANDCDLWKATGEHSAFASAASQVEALVKKLRKDGKP